MTEAVVPGSSASSNVLDDALGRLRDLSPALAESIGREVEALRDGRKFGLVFEKHMPEFVRLPSHPIKRGAQVALRAPSSGQENLRWRVLRVSGVEDGRVAHLASVAPQTDCEVLTPVGELVVVGDFGESIYPGLRLIDELSEGPDDAPWHTVINGENYHALHALKVTHQRAVDVIFIDPPYNTGSGDFSYNDKFIGDDDRYQHSKWLSFMERRLTLARDLLKDSGVIFVSIDDNEQHRLRMLLDQVFGAENFLDTIVVEMSTTSGPKVVNAQQGTIVKNVEFVHAYRKSGDFDRIPHTPLVDSVQQWDRDYSLWLNDDGTITSFVDELAADPFVAADIRKYGFVNRRGEFGGMKYVDQLLTVSKAASDFILANLDKIARRDIPPVSCSGMAAPVRGWIEVEADHRTYLLTRLRSGTLNQVYTLRRNYRMSDDYRPRYGRTVIRGDLWKGFYQDMGNVAKEGGVAFSNGKKPIRLVKQLVRWANNAPDTVVLDFFAGSGTTVHAILSMNAEDGGRRQAITVTNNEVGPQEAKRLRAAGKFPGMPEWEAEGVFWSATKVRVTNVVTGRRPDGSVYENKTPGNVAFFDLVYLDPDQVSRAKEFEAIAPLLWLKAGAVGERIAAEPEDGWALTEGYGVVTDVDAAEEFLAAVSRLDPPPAHAFVVTDSLSEYQAISQALPSGMRATRLYADYLRNFDVTGGAL